MNETLPAKTPLSVRKSRLALFRYSVDNVCDKILFVCEKKNQSTKPLSWTTFTAFNVYGGNMKRSKFIPMVLDLR